MSGNYPYKKLPSYPHMKPQDVAIWEEFINQNPDFFDTCDYDVTVGHGIIAGDLENDVYAQDFQKLTQKKIDVVGYKGEEVYIIELKPNAGASALGQIITYTTLWLEEHTDINLTLVTKMVITDLLQNDYRPIYEDNGVVVYETSLNVNA